MRRSSPLTALVVATLLAGCSAGTAGGSPVGAGTSATGDATGAATGPTGDGPRTVTSCGTTTELESTPERIVTIKSSATEMVLALGAGERLVGTAFSDGPLPEHLAAAGSQVPVLAEKNPSAESVLDLEPDLVYAGWESNLSADGAGERAMYEGLGVATYVSPAACRGEHRPDRLTADLVLAEIETMGEVLGTEGAAARLVADQRAALDDLEPSDAGLSALWYSSGTEVPYVGAGAGAPQLVMKTVGLDNIAADVDDTWTSLAWEAVADRAPDVIVLVDSAWNTAQHKIEVLEATPATAALPAVREGRYLVVPFPATEAGVRTIPAAVALAADLAELEERF